MTQTEKDIIQRAILMLEVTGSRAVQVNPEYRSYYDEARCDGYCMKDDCAVSREELQSLLDKKL